MIAMNRRNFIGLCLALLWGIGIEANAGEPFVWPKRMFEGDKLQFVEVKTAVLPEGIDLSSYDLFTGEDGESVAARVCRIDLNGDGSDELIVESNQSFSGGPQYLVFQKLKGAYKQIGEIQGGFYLCAKANGFYQIESWSRMGGGKFMRGLARFEKGQYRLIRKEKTKDSD